MIQSATKKYRRKPDKLKLWVGNTRNIPVPDNMYDAVFDFGTLHHVRDWRSALSEVHRVLKPGGRFFIEEIPRQLITHPLWRRVLDHPQEDRFDQYDLILALEESGFAVKRSRVFANLFIWCVADKE